MWSARSVAGTRRTGSNPRPFLGDCASEVFADSEQWTLVPMLIASLARSDPEDTSLHTDRLFARIRDIIKEHFANPDFGPCDVAVEAGISLRYLQKLFTARNSTCSDFINSVRLDHAAGLLKRRSF